MWVFIVVGFNVVGLFPFDMLFVSMNGTYCENVNMWTVAIGHNRTLNVNNL